MNPAQQMRSKEIAKRERAIKDRLSKNNAANLKKAKVGKAYNYEYLKDEREGFTDSDYGVGDGAAIPYQIGSAKVTKPKKGSPKPPPRPALPKQGSVISRDNTMQQAIQRRLANG
jgi:hypothetical protein